VTHLEKLTSPEILELELWVLGGTETALIEYLKAKVTEALRKTERRTVRECDEVTNVEPEPSAKQEQGTNTKQELDVKVLYHLRLPMGLLRRHELMLLGHWNLQECGYISRRFDSPATNAKVLRAEQEARGYDAINRFLANPASSSAEEDVFDCSMACEAVTLFDRANLL